MTKSEKLLRALRFLRVLDEQNNISLTNVALVATLVRLLLLPQVSIHDLGAFLGTVVGYQVRRFGTSITSPENVADLRAAVESLQTSVTGLQIGAQQTRR